MNLRITSKEDLVSGLLFIVVGGAASITAWHYPLGTLARMGPGMLPLILGALLVIIGAGVCCQSLSFREDAKGLVRNPSGPTDCRPLRPLVALVLGMGTFAILVKPFGLVPAIIALVLIVTRAERGFPVTLALILGPVLAVFSVLIFVYGLGLPFKVWF